MDDDNYIWNLAYEVAYDDTDNTIDGQIGAIQN